MIVLAMCLPAHGVPIRHKIWMSQAIHSTWGVFCITAWFPFWMERQVELNNIDRYLVKSTMRNIDSFVVSYRIIQKEICSRTLTIWHSYPRHRRKTIDCHLSRESGPYVSKLTWSTCFIRTLQITKGHAYRLPFCLGFSFL